MDFKDTCEFLYSLIDYEKKAGFPRSLDAFTSLLDVLGSPEKELKNVVHIVGTKGKGSTGVHIVAGLMSMGMKVGFYTSPHLVDIRERITVNLKKIPEDKFCSYIEELRPHFESRRGIRTFFEILTATAILYFRDEEVDYAVFEAGLGGRLDATNVFEKKSVIITPISHDHMDILGDTLDKIAFEKASVIEKGNPVFSTEQEKEALRVITKMVEDKGTTLRMLGKDASYIPVEVTLEGSRFKFLLGDEREFMTPLLGKFQVQNAALSAFALLSLVEKEFDFKSAKLRGRFDIVEESPHTVLLDGAHNPFSLRALLSSVEEIIPHEKLIVVFGASKNKDIPTMLDILSEVSDVLIATRAETPRAASPWDIANEAMELMIPRVKAVNNPLKALEIAKGLAGEGDLILVTGSFYLVGDILKELGVEVFY